MEICRVLHSSLELVITKTENTAIKDDYLRRPEVLEYVLWHVLNLAGSDDPGCYYTLSTPPVALAVLEEYKQTNDPVRAFWSEMSNQLVWDLLPFTFLYDLYKPWFADVSPSGSPVSSKQFIADLLAIVHSDTMWGCPDKNRSIRTNNRMDGPEPLIAEYNLVKWKNPSYSGTDPLRISMPALAVSYRGLVRTGLAPAVDAPQEDDALSGIKERTTEC